MGSICLRSWVYENTNQGDRDIHPKNNIVSWWEFSENFRECSMSHGKQDATNSRCVADRDHLLLGAQT